MKTILALVMAVLCLAVANAQTPRRATATANVVNGFVVGVTVTDGGYGYTNVPPVHIIGGGGSNALLTASISNSVVSTITVNIPGAGYSAASVVSIAPPVIPLPQMRVSPASYLLFTHLQTNFPMSLSGAYFLMKNISGVWVNQQLTDGRGGTYIGTDDGTYSTLVNGVATANTYALAAFPIPVQAVATAQVTNGFVVGINITNYGMGYTVAPAVQIIGGGGSGAQAVASTVVVQAAFPYEVSSITVTAPGSGYTSIPDVVIGPPDATLQFASPPIITPEILLGMSNMLTNLTYQLQTSRDLIAWTNVEASFLSSTSTSASYLYATNASGFFRLQYVP